MTAPLASTPEGRGTRSLNAFLRAFHGYAAWLVSISWKRFLLLSLLLLILTGVLQNLPPFTWTSTETVVEQAPTESRPRKSSSRPAITIEKDGEGPDKDVNIVIGGQGIRITKKRPTPPSSPASAASAANANAETSETKASPNTPSTPTPPTPPGSRELAEGRSNASGNNVTIVVPSDVDSEEVRQAVKEAREAIAVAIQEARGNDLSDDEDRRGPGRRTRKVTTSMGEALPELAFLWIVVSAIIKFTYKGQLRAEAQAAVAAENAEAEALKRQVVEARMAAMQAQVEPHFLFNTLGSIDHLIETDPPRASKMQKNLIALLRASMPNLREANGQGLRDLGSEVAVIQPYLEILKVRMEDRLQASVEVSEGLKSAAFPPMMLQGLVENAIKHGLEPKPEGGSLVVKAEVVHGRLEVTVSDTGLGFGKANTAGTGVGLSNIRERLQLLYGNDAQLSIRAREPSGTSVTITVPYKTVDTSTRRST